MKQKSTTPIQTESPRAIMDEFFKKRGIPNATKEIEGKVRIVFTTSKK